MRGSNPLILLDFDTLKKGILPRVQRIMPCTFACDTSHPATQYLSSPQINHFKTLAENQFGGRPRVCATGTHSEGTLWVEADFGFSPRLAVGASAGFHSPTLETKP